MSNQAGTFGGRLRQVRKERMLSQNTLAEILGTSKQVISRYETNQRVPKITTVTEYAKKLNVTILYLMGNPEPLPEPAADRPSYVTLEACAVALAYDRADTKSRRLIRHILDLQGDAPDG